MKKLLLVTKLLIILKQSIFAQITGSVIDEVTKKPIPYVNIHIAGTQKGFTTNENGVFSIDVNQNDTAVFSAVGFKSKWLPIKLISNKILLSQKVYKIKEIVVGNRKHVYARIGSLKRQFPGSHFGSNLGYSAIDGQLIPYENKFENTPFIKSIKFLTHSSVRNAKFNIRLYQLNGDGKPGKLIHSRNIIGIARKGNRKTIVDLDSLNIIFPKSGLVVAIEWLNIDANKFDYTYTMEGAKKKLKGTSIEPSFSLYKGVGKGARWSYWGDWHKCGMKQSIQMEIILKN